MEQEKVLTMMELLSSSDKYFIPIYQRNYAWDFPQVYQLIEDIADYAEREKGKTNKTKYYLGNLITLPDNEDSTLFETIDGQQRLTTLYIIICSLSKDEDIKYDLSWFNRGCLTFRNREKSNNALERISKAKEHPIEKCEGHILSIFNSASTKTKSICTDKGISIQEFLDYFLHDVEILRINVPHDVDKNHYFEVMNSRGVQLEQHEIVKASLMEPLKDNPKELVVFNSIWKACSNMEKYIQMNFDSKNRSIIFGNEWVDDPNCSFDELVGKFEIESVNEKEKTLAELIINYKPEQVKNNEDNKPKDGDEQFYSVINFQNFLLHVLKILCSSSKEQFGNTSVALDDKMLSDTFDKVMKACPDKKLFVKSFATCLLRCRYFFDMYTVRHMYSKDPDKWVMLRLNSRTDQNEKKRQPYYVNTFSGLEDSQSNDELIMLLSMFHVSVPAMIYKNWLYACLKYVYLTKEITQEGYTIFLKNLAKSYMLDRYFATNDSKYELSEISDRYCGDDIIPAKNKLGDITPFINAGTSVEVFVFNYYDYLLWLKGNKPNFTFTHRNSVEHFFPQHPEDRKPMESRYLNSFGNLCLITSSQNSKFTNLMPGAKYSQFKDRETVVKQSLKLQSIFDTLMPPPDGKGKWDEKEIKDAEESAILVFKEFLN